MKNQTRFYRNEIILGGTTLETQTTDLAGTSETAKDYFQMSSLTDLFGYKSRNVFPFLEASVEDKSQRNVTALLVTPNQLVTIAVNQYVNQRLPKAQLFIRAVGTKGLERIIKIDDPNTRKSLSLHGMTLDAYCKLTLNPRGGYQYYLSSDALADSVGVTPKALGSKLLPKPLKAMLPEGWMGSELSVKNHNGADIKINGWDLQSCMIFWQYYALKDNKKALQIIKTLTLIGLISLLDEVYGRAPELTQSKLIAAV